MRGKGRFSEGMEKMKKNHILLDHTVMIFALSEEELFVNPEFSESGYLSSVASGNAGEKEPVIETVAQMIEDITDESERK